MNGWTTMLRAEWDRVAGWLLVIAGTAAVVLAFLGVADSPYVSDQLAYIASGGVGGLLLVAVGVGLLISADLHDEWRKLDRIEAAIRGEALPDAREVVLSAAAPRNGDAGAFGQHRSPAPVQSVSMMQLASIPRAPWPAATIDWRGERLRLGLARSGAGVAVAALLVAAGWWRAAETSDFNTAVGGAGWAVTGLLASAIAIATYLLWVRGRLGGRKGDLFGDWLLAGVAAERRRRRVGGDSAPEGVVVATEGDYLVADGGRRYHRVGCPALANLTARPVATDHVGPTLRPCGLCLAD